MQSSNQARIGVQGNPAALVFSCEFLALSTSPTLVYPAFTPGMASYFERQPKPLTYRVQNIPLETTEENFKFSYFTAQDRDYIKIKSWSLSIDSSEDEFRSYTATIFFYPPMKRELETIGDNINLDKDFLGFTPLFTPPMEKGPILAE